MTWSRRQFLTGVGVLAAVSGTAGRVVAKTLNINGVRYGMVHDESLCIGCTACMDACREVNKVPEGVSRLTIIRSEPQGEFPDVKYRFFRKSCQHCDHAPCVEACPTKALTFGNLDDPNSEISQLLRQKPTYRYKLALGTKPKLYRVPFKYGEVSQ
ncbi:4Fe-4S dicluster domain-containing protein [Escherichia coli]|nr:4Fe-4S dicluster domain-containing protein [Escherichia coli]EFL5812449.1 4Fe-4S dicluster domain-containing protein [Escherichia coli]EHM2217035.1 4Fe-4S dicluster domain-containing protein [Escherichia coli]EJV2632200.1 4Fe-4S dicluster domain-containing protein [Escherichia coli]EKD1123518.1 4Fe-4S dicluster domain-containing protein [Escherichia coli]